MARTFSAPRWAGPSVSAGKTDLLVAGPGRPASKLKQANEARRRSHRRGHLAAKGRQVVNGPARSKGSAQKPFRSSRRSTSIKVREWFQEKPRPSSTASCTDHSVNLVETLSERFEKAKLGPARRPQEIALSASIADGAPSPKDKRPYNRHLSAILSPDGHQDVARRPSTCIFGLERCFAGVAWVASRRRSCCRPCARRSWTKPAVFPRHGLIAQESRP